MEVLSYETNTIMAYEFRIRYKSVVFCVVFCIALFALLSVYPLVASLFVLPLFTASDHSYVSSSLSYVHITDHLQSDREHMPIIPT
jgi:hypothetical protein